jgi:hypothetical protein
LATCALRKKKDTKGRKAKKTRASTPATTATNQTPPAASDSEATPAVGSIRKRTSKKRSIQYSSEQQAEIVQFVHDYNAKNGRAGQSSASKKYGVSALTISKWLKASGKPAKKKAPGRPGRPTAAAKSQRVAEGIEGTLKRMLEIQTKLDGLRAEYDGLRARL